MAKRDEVFKDKSKYFNASNLPGPLTVVIERAPMETLKNDDGEGETKTVLYFKRQQKCLPLNITNWDSVADITGKDDTDNWPGHKIELFPTTTEMKGKTVPCIRIRQPRQAELALKKPPPAIPPLTNELDDEVPF
jgi:hypothetical protein